MNNVCWLLVLLAVCISELELVSADNDGHFVNSWTAEIRGGIDVARDVAEQHGYRLVRSLEPIEDHYMLERSDTPHRSRRSADHHTRKLSEDDRVVYVEQQQHKVRVKRDFVDRDLARQIVQNDGQLDDPYFPNEWYINPGGDTNRRDRETGGLNIADAWRRGFTGTGVSVVVLDDGLEKNHPDLKDNYDPRSSFDLNDDDDDPSPRYDPTNENKHGTRCAGEIAMIANNKECGVGIAFNAKIGGVRMLDGTVTDTIEGQALSRNMDYVDIFSASWGPNDDGRTCEGPGKFTRKALEQGVQKGRGGLGSVFVWAAGNGGHNGDNCNSDGYTLAMETISVGSASQDGHIPYYCERCASTMTTTYSSGSSSERKVVSSDLHGKCTDNHSGTSAAAPMAAGIIALLLEANRNLTWRDIQHIVVHTSKTGPLYKEKGWYRNGFGYCVNLAFGFGLMDALAMVNLGDPKTWKRVGQQRACRVESVPHSGFPRNFVSGESVTIEFRTDGCKGQENEINSMEHAQVIVDIDHEKRGNIYVEVESPSGTITPIMMERENDASKKGFVKWPLSSVHQWGEKPQGVWIVRVADRTNQGLRGSVKNVTLVLHGTKEQPEHMKNYVSKCPELDTHAEIDRDSGRHSSISSLMAKLKSPEPSHGTQAYDKLASWLQSLHG
ncbi:hypothetical protein BsWGS_00153 [Bradybaena similaris]